MGWMRTLFLGDIGNHLDIQDTRRDTDALREWLRSSAARQNAVDAEQSGQIASLRAEVEDLEMAVAALSRLLMSRGVVSESEIAAIVEKIDR
jgi:hypothetical protein